MFIFVFGLISPRRIRCEDLACSSSQARGEAASLAHLPASRRRTTPPLIVFSTPFSSRSNLVLFATWKAMFSASEDLPIDGAGRITRSGFVHYAQ